MDERVDERMSGWIFSGAIDKWIDEWKVRKSDNWKKKEREGEGNGKREEGIFRLKLWFLWKFIIEFKRVIW